MKDFRYMAIVAVAAAGLALAGCSSSSGVSTSERDAAVAAAEAEKQMQIDMLQEQIAALEKRLGIEGDTDPGDDVATLNARITTLEAELKAKEDAEQMAMEEEERRQAAMAAATAAKLYAGIGTDPLGVEGRDVVSNTAGAITVTRGTGIDAVALSADKKAMVADNHGWNGARHTGEDADDGMIEATVYSNVGDTPEGDPFAEQYSDNFSDGTLDETTTEGTASRIDSPNFDQSAGLKLFKLPSPNPDGVSRINIAGSYHGVSGTYTCVPGGNVCAAQVAEAGFSLGGVTSATDATTFGAGNATWTFKPSNSQAKVKGASDNIYASYGWWIHKAANDGAWTASAFVADRGEVPDAAGIGALRGTATYMGGAAGKYALSSSTGGMNDAGHFTARAMLEADFNTDMVSGTIDMFMNEDGESRDWEVELNKTDISDTGLIDGMTGDPAASVGTVWTIDGIAAAKSGEWSGSLQNNGDDGVPRVASGTFSSTYGGDGRMVGAFGANKQ